jgi:hypothetical protein
MLIQTYRPRRRSGGAVGLAGVLLGALGVACGTQVRAASDWERGVELGPSKTFSVARSPALPANLTPDQTRVVAMVDETIRRELAKKGYREAPAEAAELVLMSSFAFRERIRVGSHACADYAPNVSRSSCQQATVTNFDEATLLIDVYDGRSRELVWHGWATGERPEQGDADTPELAKQATLDILERFPP